MRYFCKYYFHSVNYIEYLKMKSKSILFFSGLISLISVAQTRPSLSFYADQNKIKIGAAVGSAFYSNYNTGSTYDTIVNKNFNILVAENEMKFNALEPTQNTFNWTSADKLVVYAYSNDKQVRGHTLCWHSQLPSWVTNGVFTRATLMAALKNHITTIVTRYKGLVQQWDVLNEPFDDGYPTTALRASVWQSTIGSDYIDSVFVWANRADPSAKLFLNDYNVEYYGNNKANFMFNYVSQMKSRKIPIHGVGFQCHLGVGFSTKTSFTNIDQNIKRYATLGLDVAITELDVAIANTDYAADSIGFIAKQATDYDNIIKLCLNNPNCKTILTWGFTDKYSWIPASSSNTKGHALIYDNAYKAKPAYYAMLNELALASGKTAVPQIANNDKVNITRSRNAIVINSEDPIVKCSVYDIQGRCIYNSTPNSNIINIPDITLGQSIYIVKTQLINGNIITKKI